MQHDDVICSCPLANSRYDATIRHHDGVFYLYMKTIERAHMPNKLWERVKLPRNYEKALEIIDKHLSIDKELLERLKKGVYGDIYNYPPVEEYPEVLDSEDEMEEEMEYVEGYEELEEEDDIEEFGGLAIQKSHIDVDDGVDDEDEEAVTVYRKRVKRHSNHEKDESNAKLKKKKARVLVEVEHENTDERQVAVQ